jgi:sec-independent protein translocase protein TatB
MAVVGVIALIIIGPKDLPRIMRWVGGWVGKARGMARQFQRSIDDLAREADLEDVKKSVDSVSKINPTQELDKAIDPTGSVKKALDPSSTDATSATEDSGAAADPEPASEKPDEAEAEPDAAKEPVSADGESLAEAPKTQASA